MLHQRLADTRAEDHVEHANRHAGTPGGAEDGIRHQFRRGHVAAVRFEHHGAAGRQCGGRIAAGGRKRQREIARAEHCHRTNADAALAQVHARQRRALRLCTVDAGTEEIAPPQNAREQAHLPACAGALTLDARGRQRGLAADDGDERLVQRIQLIGDGIQELRAALGRQATIGRECCGRGVGGGIHFLHRSLDEALRQHLAGGGVQAAQDDGSGRAAAATDVVVAGVVRHINLLRYDVPGCTGMYRARKRAPRA